MPRFQTRIDEVAEWCGGEAYQRYLFGEPQTMVVGLPHHTEIVEAIESMWIVKHRGGTISRLRDDEFRSKYVEIKETPA